ncbi:MAG: alpha/beta fold hydrolase, partial [Gammaproteobacteria bacterium]
MPSVTLPSGRIHYREAGQGVQLLLLHANPGDSRDYDAVFAALAERYRVIAIDWPGYGLSALPDLTVDIRLFDRSLREFLAALSLPAALFIGNSVGANVAARLAIESPGSVLGLVLVTPGGFTPHNAFTRAFCRLQGSRFALPPRLLATLYLRHRNATVAGMLARASAEQS